MSLVTDLLDGDKRALAKVLTQVENSRDERTKIIKELYPKAGDAHVVGITGAPGSGKSTLIASLVRRAREEEMTVAVVAVDPTSPYTGGSLMGDRIRMSEFAEDEGVFIRSMANRGFSGGLSESTRAVVTVLDAFGIDLILVETVGAGQADTYVSHLADTVVLVTVPGSGDYVQLMKAGITEIGDIFVVNKGDLKGAQEAYRQFKANVELYSRSDGWEQPVLLTTAESGEGVQELLSEIKKHRKFTLEHRENSDSRRRQGRHALMEAIHTSVDEMVEERLGKRGLEELVSEVSEYDTDPYTAAKEALERAGVKRRATAR